MIKVEDKVIHTLVAIAMVIVYSLIPGPIVIVLAVMAHWYCWELAQRVAKDAEKRGVLYWWNINLWSSTAQNEAIWPMAGAGITGILLLLI